MTGEADASDGGAGAPPPPENANHAPDFTREYAGNGISVQWYASRCIHSANCVRALPLVFDPKRRPWVNATAASADAVAEAVRRCPSGALHFVRNDGNAQESPDHPTTITPIRNGPFYLRGDIEVRAADGEVLRRDLRVSICRCPHTQKTPFCDNSCRQERWRESSTPMDAATG